VRLVLGLESCKPDHAVVVHQEEEGAPDDTHGPWAYQTKKTSREVEMCNCHHISYQDEEVPAVA
jgi:hypothetical protein